MRKRMRDKVFLRVLFLFGVGIIPVIFRKSPIKDSFLVYLWNAVTNGIIDNILVSYKVVKYPVRLLPNVFKTNILFNYLWYPLITVAYNRLTMKDNFVKVLIKLFYFTIPLVLFELWAARRTGLIKFSRKWKWYHSFFSLHIKSLVTRLWISWIRRMEKEQRSKHTSN